MPVRCEPASASTVDSSVSSSSSRSSSSASTRSSADSSSSRSGTADSMGIESAGGVAVGEIGHGGLDGYLAHWRAHRAERGHLDDLAAEEHMRQAESPAD